MEQAPEPTQELFNDRAIEPQLPAQRLQGVRIVLFAQHDLHRITRDQMNERKHDQTE
jgi:hypothetical protein